MAKNQINFTKITEEARTQLNTFKESAYAIAEEDLRFKAEMKPFKARLEIILKNRDNDIKQGMSVDEVAEKFPRTEVDNEIRKAEDKHKKIVEPLNTEMKSTYKFVPDSLFDAYNKKINEGKRGDVLNAIKEFLTSLGLEVSGAQLTKFAESMSDKLGAKYATSKAIIKNNTLVTAMKKNQFNKLFMAVFVDTYLD